MIEEATCIVPGCTRRAVCVKIIHGTPVPNQQCVEHWQEMDKRRETPQPIPAAPVQKKAGIAKCLRSFVQSMCADFGTDLCGKCSVLDEHAPCRRFEQVVLGPAEYPYKVIGYDYEKLFEAYGKINPAMSCRVVVSRRCDCGEPLRPHERICEKCRRDRRKASYRRSKCKNRSE